MLAGSSFPKLREVETTANPCAGVLQPCYEMLSSWANDVFVTSCHELLQEEVRPHLSLDRDGRYRVRLGPSVTFFAVHALGGMISIMYGFDLRQAQCFKHAPDRDI